MFFMDHPRSHAPGPSLASPDLRALQALAEPNRARIVELLGHGEHCVCDVGGTLGLSSALVSHHLRVLRESGLVRERRDGRWVHYSLEIERLARLREAVVAVLTPPEAASTECASSGCGPTTRRPGSAVMQLDAVGTGR
jgi:ArsR family transcriptional regulator, arsenate/arsenite/antimonite-responsive transcriptional repressor